MPRGERTDGTARWRGCASRVASPSAPTSRAARGQDLIESVITPLMQRERRAFHALGEDEQVQLLALTERLVSLLSDALGTDH